MSIDIKEFELLNDEILSILWNDSHLSYLVIKDIRNSCPCATCRTAREGFKKSISLLPPDSYRITSFQKVGQYGIQFKWGDGHETGIFTYQRLRELCTCKDCED